MPTYDYRCTKCGHRFEVFHGIKDETLKRCPRCKRKAVRVPAGGAGLLFKGSGFYITDYRSKSYKEKARSDAGGLAKAPGETAKAPGEAAKGSGESTSGAGAGDAGKGKGKEKRKGGEG